MYAIHAPSQHTALTFICNVRFFAYRTHRTKLQCEFFKFLALHFPTFLLACLAADMVWFHLGRGILLTGVRGLPTIRERIDSLASRAITPMFATIYGFNVQQTGYVYITTR